MRVPALIFVNAPVAPEIAPPIVNWFEALLLVSIVKVWPEAIEIFRVLDSEKVVVAAGSCSVPLPVTVKLVAAVIGAVPSAASALIFNVPAAKVVPLP